jgi:hypothetical protein
MDERARRVSELLHEAGEVHHVVYRITDGADDDWASFYADWLIEHSGDAELGERHAWPRLTRRPNPVQLERASMTPTCSRARASRRPTPLRESPHVWRSLPE